MYRTLMVGRRPRSVSAFITTGVIIIVTTIRVHYLATLQKLLSNYVNISSVDSVFSDSKEATCCEGQSLYEFHGGNNCE